MRGRTLAVWRSIKLGAVTVALPGVLTANDLCAMLHDQSATPDEYPAGSGPADFRGDISGTGLFGECSEDLIPSSATVWLPDSFNLAAFCTGQTSTESSWVCVDAAAITTVDTDGGRADVTIGCVSVACSRGDTSTQCHTYNTRANVNSKHTS